MAPFRLSKHQDVLEFPKLKRVIPPAACKDPLSSILKGIICQCLSDRVPRVAFGIEPITGRSYMLYSLSTPSNGPAWREMTPPPPQAIPLFYKFLVSLLDENKQGAEGRLTGIIRANLNNAPFTLYLRAESCNAFELYADESISRTNPFCIATDSDSIERAN